MNNQTYGPSSAISRTIHATKYRHEGETFDDYCVRFARATTSNMKDFKLMLDGLREQRILPAGRQQLSVGRATAKLTAMNCYVGGRITDSMEGIANELKNSMLTLRSGGGCGWDFSSLRPFGEPVRGLGAGAYASGPVSFMQLWNAMCATILSAGNRRGAMMAVLRVDHPDIMRFVNAKAEEGALSNFNVSVGVTDAFMAALRDGTDYELRFGGRTHGRVAAADVWARIMERNWDWAEPGILFLDEINRQNPLHYCETIAATNPCGEQPLPPYGACLLGSVNVVKYIMPSVSKQTNVGSFTFAGYDIDYSQLETDVKQMVKAFNRVIDITNYPLKQQQREAYAKRRMGIGVTGMANAIETMGFAYGTPEYLNMQDAILRSIRDFSYEQSIACAVEQGTFPAFNATGWLSSGFASTLDPEMKKDIGKYGLRNGLLTSIAPTGTISIAADNVSSGIEPVYKHSVRRAINLQGFDEPQMTEIQDYAFGEFKVKGKTCDEVTAEEHVDVLCRAQRYVDSAVSKTCNVGPKVTFDEFQAIYLRAWEGGAKGCTTFRAAGKRAGIFEASGDDSADAGNADANDGAACVIDPETGIRTCDF